VELLPVREGLQETKALWVCFNISAPARQKSGRPGADPTIFEFTATTPAL
jgi:hypothetical protein